MEYEDRNYYILTIDTKEPVELQDFIGQLAGFGNQFEKFIKKQHPSLDGEAKFLVKDVRHGSMVFDILPIIQPLFQHVEHLVLLDTFVCTWKQRVSTYFKKGGRDTSANKADLKDVISAIKAIARDPKAVSKLEYVKHTDGKRETETVFQFDNKQANRALQELENHQFELAEKGDAQRKRVSMVFTRPDSGGAAVGKRSGEKCLISAISPKPRPVIYVSELVEEQIKDELRHGENNIFKLAFIVDVNVEIINNKPAAYRITHLHQIIELDEE